MSIEEVIGWTGAALFIVAYFLLSISKRPESKETFTLKLDTAKPFYKILLKGPHHYANIWVTEQKPLRRGH